MEFLAIAAALGFGFQTASAQEPGELNAQQLDGLLNGNTVYIAVTIAGQDVENRPMARFKYGMNGDAAAKLPNGKLLKGTWKIEEAQYCVNWTNGPKNSCTRVIRANGALTLINVKSGNARGSIVKIVPGNPENL